MNAPRTWNDGWRCGECCNGDRCDDPSHVDRKNCKHCFGSGIAVRNMYAKEREVKERIAALERDLAAAHSCASTLAVSMHKQHYAEAAPNWQPLPDLVGLLTQIDNMYAGLRNDLEAAEIENKRLVGLPLAKAQAEAAALRERANALLHQIDIGDYVDSEGHALKNNIAVLTLMKALTNV